MKKRFTPPVLVLLAVLILFSITSCKDKPVEAPHEHTWDGGAVTTPPTCTEKGVKTFKCTGCDETMTEPVEATGHTWDTGNETTAPTCTEKGVKTFKCKVCDETKTEDIPASHKSDEGKVIEEPGYGKKGKKLSRAQSAVKFSEQKISMLSAQKRR